MNKAFDGRSTVPRASYEADLHAWAQEQAALLRAGRSAEAGVANIAEDWRTWGGRSSIGCGARCASSSRTC